MIDLTKLASEAAQRVNKELKVKCDVLQRLLGEKLYELECVKSALRDANDHVRQAHQRIARCEIEMEKAIEELQKQTAAIIKLSRDNDLLRAEAARGAH